MRMSTMIMKMLLLKFCLMTILVIPQAHGSGLIRSKTSSIRNREKRENFWEGCSSEGIPYNAEISCKSSTGCRSTCSQGNTFPNGRSTLDLECHHGRWRTSSGSYNIPNCQGVSGSGGFNWEGCTKTGLPAGSKISCSSNSGCKVTCNANYHLSNGKQHMTLQCSNGLWTHHGRTNIPQCEAVCSPSCQNGGECVAPGQCRCTKDFRGELCQHGLSACDITAVGYDGGYSCSWDNTKYSCDLYCTTKEEAITHTCYFSSGQWSPPITMCNPDVETFDVNALERGEIEF